MTRSINPVPQWTKGSEPIAAGEMYFFDTQSNTPKSTFADAAETTANTHPLILDAEGRLPNCFFSGLAKQILTEPSPFTQGDGRGTQVFNRDPVGQEIAISAFDVYAAGSSYQINSIVTTSSGQFWKSLISGNIGFNPVTDNGDHWQQISFSDFYASGVTFAKNDKAISTVDGLPYISGIDSNKGNEPSANLDKWALDRPALPYVSGKTYSTGETAISIVDKREYESQSAQSGNEPSVSPVQWLPIDGLVTTPVNVSPADTATGVSRMPTLTTDAFAVTGSNANFEWGEFQLSIGATFTNVDYTSGIVRDEPSHTVTELLLAATQYSYRMVKKGVRTNISTSSTVTTFTTTFPLDEFFSDDVKNGTGTARAVSNNISLAANEGFVLIGNIDSTANFRLVDTIGLAGNEIILPTGGTIRVPAAAGITSFNTTGYSVGTDVAYNAAGDDIYSLTFRSRAGLCDIVVYSGTGVAQSPAHIMAADVGFKMICYTTGSPTQTSGGVVQFKSMAQNKYLTFAQNFAETTLASFWGAADTTTAFGVGTQDRNNESGIGFIAVLIADNPSAGATVKSYLGTGSAGLKITTGFPVAVMITKSESSGDWYIADKRLGTGELIKMDANFQRQAGGVVSFENDGIILNADATNVSGERFQALFLADGVIF